MTEIAAQQSPASAGCPMHGIGGGFQPYYSEELYAALAAARRDEPLFYCPEIGFWIVTKHADVLSILHDTERFSSQNASTRLTPLHEDALKILRDGDFTPELTQASLDPPRHTRIRAATNPLLNIRTAAKLEAQIRGIVRKALDRLEGRNRVDLLKEFTYELPAHVIFLVLGVPDEDAQAVKAVAAGRTQIDFSPSTYEQQLQGARNLVAHWKYTLRLVQDRVEHPKDDITSGLLAIRNGDDAILTMNEINTITYGLLFAGHETTTNQLTNTFRELLSDRENWEALCADPTLIPNAVEEGFRFCGAVIGWRRRAKTEVEIGGVTLPAGANLMLSFASANRDETVFERPEKFDVRRANARKHLTLGNGIHFCLGAPLARLEMKIVFEEFIQRFPNVRLVEDQEQKHFHTFVFRAPESLWVELEP